MSTGLAIGIGAAYLAVGAIVAVAVAAFEDADHPYGDEELDGMARAGCVLFAWPIVLPFALALLLFLGIGMGARCVARRLSGTREETRDATTGGVR